MQTWNKLKMEVSALEAKLEATPDKEVDAKEVPPPPKKNPTALHPAASHVTQMPWHI